MEVMAVNHGGVGCVCGGERDILEKGRKIRQEGEGTSEIQMTGSGIRFVRSYFLSLKKEKKNSKVDYTI